MVTSMPVSLLGAPHAEAVLLLLRSQGPVRFNAIRRATKLNPNQVDRALQALTRDMLVLPRTLPPEHGRLFVTYEVTRRGAEVAALIDALLENARARKADIGSKLVREIEGLYPASA